MSRSQKNKDQTRSEQNETIPWNWKATAHTRNEQTKENREKETKLNHKQQHKTESNFEKLMDSYSKQSSTLRSDSLSWFPSRSCTWWHFIIRKNELKWTWCNMLLLLLLLLLKWYSCVLVSVTWILLKKKEIRACFVVYLISSFSMFVVPCKSFDSIGLTHPRRIHWINAFAINIFRLLDTQIFNLYRLVAIVRFWNIH